jgi:hypothetical protein
MTTHVNGQVAASTATPTAQLSTYRHALIQLLGEATTVITIEEYEAATQNIYACQSLATLQKWYRNCVRLIADREEAQPVAELIDYATASQKEEVIKLANSVWIQRAEKVRAVLNINTLTYPLAKALIADLWGKILHRQEQAAEGYGSAHLSFADAA